MSQGDEKLIDAMARASVNALNATDGRPALTDHQWTAMMIRGPDQYAELVLGMRAALAVVRHAEGWRDIATAPENGSDVWVFGGRFTKPTILPGRWRLLALRDHPKCPTHWQPLIGPAPPEAAP